MSWQTVKLGDTCEVKRGTTITEKQAQAGDVPVVAGGLTYSYTHNTANRKGNVITVSGSGANAGYVNFWKQPIFASDCSTIQSLSEAIDIRFVFYFLKSKQQFINSTLRSGAAQPHVYAKDIAQMMMPLPPIAEQKRIAAILDKADEIRRKREQTIAKLDQLAQSIFVEMFKDAIQSNVRIELSELIGEFRYGTSNKSGAFGYPTLRIPNVAYGSLDLSELKTVEVTEEEFKRLKLIEGDLLFVRTNGNAEYVGRCVVFNPVDVANTGFDPSKYIYASYLIRARLESSSVLPIVIQQFLSTAEGKQALKARCKTSAGQFNINTEGLGSLPIPNFPMSSQQSFIALKKSIDQQKIVHQKALAKQTQLFASLQHQAFTGQL